MTISIEYKSQDNQKEIRHKNNPQEQDQTNSGHPLIRQARQVAV